MDITFIRRVILGITNVFPCGVWRFVPAAYVCPDPLNPWSAPGSCGYTSILADRTNESYVAIKLGDVNNSWTAPAGAMGLADIGSKAERATASGLGMGVMLTASSHNVEPGETVTAWVSATGFRQVTSAQFTLEWDPTVLRYVATGNHGLEGISAGSFGTSSADNGKLTFSWDDPSASGVTLPDGAAIFRVSFKVVGKAGSSSALTLGDSCTPREVGVDFAAVSLQTQNGLVKVVVPGRPTLTQAGCANGIFRVSLQTLGGKSYILEFTDDLTGSHWTALPPVAGDGTVRILTDPVATTQQRCYRVRIE